MWFRGEPNSRRIGEYSQLDAGEWLIRKNIETDIPKNRHSFLLLHPSELKRQRTGLSSWRSIGPRFDCVGPNGSALNPGQRRLGQTRAPAHNHFFNG